MSAEIVKFEADKSDQEVIIGILERALAKAKEGKVKDVALVLAEHDDDGPMHVTSYYGDGAYATLVAGVASLAFSLQYDRHKADEGRE